MLLQHLLRRLDLVLELLVLPVVLAELDPGGPSDVRERCVLVGAHPGHDLLRVLRLAGLELLQGSLQLHHLRLVHPVPLHLGDIVGPGLQTEVQQAVVGVAGATHEGALHASQLLLLVVEEGLLGKRYLLLVLSADSPLALASEHDAQPSAKRGRKEGLVVGLSEAHERLLGLLILLCTKLLQLGLHREEFLLRCLRKLCGAREAVEPVVHALEPRLLALVEGRHLPAGLHHGLLQDLLAYGHGVDLLDRALYPGVGLLDCHSLPLGGVGVGALWPAGILGVLD
mmetsp:Transcript_15564/g.48995  ORF Transcript_15564/g.48995 Transcript_15564/m.48995 type:complete len:284 (-) Transcript_15564:448-1299(-)